MSTTLSLHICSEVVTSSSFSPAITILYLEILVISKYKEHWLLRIKLSQSASKKLKIDEKGGYQLQMRDNLPQSRSHMTRVNKSVFTVTKLCKLVF